MVGGQSDCPPTVVSIRLSSGIPLASRICEGRADTEITGTICVCPVGSPGKDFVVDRFACCVFVVADAILFAVTTGGDLNPAVAMVYEPDLMIPVSG